VTGEGEFRSRPEEGPDAAEVARHPHVSLTRPKAASEVDPIPKPAPAVGTVVIILRDDYAAKRPELAEYLAAPFSLKPDGRPHLLKFEAARSLDLIVRPLRGPAGTGVRRSLNNTVAQGAGFDRRVRASGVKGAAEAPCLLRSPAICIRLRDDFHDVLQLCTEGVTWRLTRLVCIGFVAMSSGEPESRTQKVVTSFHFC
jgi:hypothetical protein